MENIIVKLKNTQGIFDIVMSSKHTFSDNMISEANESDINVLRSKHTFSDNMVYRSMSEDKANINNDMRAFFSDFKKATNEAKVKQTHYE